MIFGKNTNEAYNIQAFSNNHVLVALDVTQDENDQAQLQPLTEQLLKNLGNEGCLEEEPITLLADAGYNKGENLSYVDHNPEVDAYISMYRRKDEVSPFARENFSFNENEDEYQCPNNKTLENLREIKSADKIKNLYAARIEDCIYCKSKSDCITSKADIKRGYRTIEDDDYAVFRHAMREKLATVQGKEKYRQRGGEIEPKFGWMKKVLRQFLLRGTDGAKMEAYLTGIAFNLLQISKRTQSAII